MYDICLTEDYHNDLNVELVRVLVTGSPREGGGSFRVNATNGCCCYWLDG